MFSYLDEEEKKKFVSWLRENRIKHERSRFIRDMKLEFLEAGYFNLDETKLDEIATKLWRKYGEK